MSFGKISVFLHQNDEHFVKTSEAIERQTYEDIETIVLNETEDRRATQLRQAAQKADGDFILYIDNRQNDVVLKRSAVELLVLEMRKHANTVLIYSDYERGHTQDDIEEVHLLEYHAGRVRDNMDFGKVICYRVSALQQAGGFDASLDAAELYDMRLKLSEAGDLTLISNRYAGSLYRVLSSGKERHNVFDYLLDDKSVQLEMEKVLTEHLKRINAYLPPENPWQEVIYTEEEQRDHQSRDDDSPV